MPQQFVFSTTSIKRMDGVLPILCEWAHLTLRKSEVDFLVGRYGGLRSDEIQEMLLANKRTWTLKSWHKKQKDGYGHALDLWAWIMGSVSWEERPYFKIAAAGRLAAIDLGIKLRWGGAWHIDDIRDWDGSMRDAFVDYVKTRISEGKTPTTDLPHWHCEEFRWQQAA